MMKFKKKPVVIEAHQFVNGADPFGVVNTGYPKADDDKSAHHLDGKSWINTLEGPFVVSEGDWIICGVKGEFYPCKPDIFAATYEPVAEVEEGRQGK